MCIYVDVCLCVYISFPRTIIKSMTGQEQIVNKDKWMHREEMETSFLEVRMVPITAPRETMISDCSSSHCPFCSRFLEPQTQKPNRFVTATWLRKLRQFLAPEIPVSCHYFFRLPTHKYCRGENRRKPFISKTGLDKQQQVLLLCCTCRATRSWSQVVCTSVIHFLLLLWLPPVPETQKKTNSIGRERQREYQQRWVPETLKEHNSLRYGFVLFLRTWN